MGPQFRLTCLLTAALIAAAPASADIVRLANGRTLTVDAYRFEGETAVLILRAGEVRITRDQIAEILPDEPVEPAVTVLLPSGPVAQPRLSRQAVQTLVDRIAAAVGLDAKLAHAVVRVESNYNNLAISPKGAMGLMQVMPVIARQYSVQNPFDPVENLSAGMRHLRYLTERFDIRRALAAYNAGEAAVARYGGVPPYPETQTYVRRVMTYLRTPGR
jgi:soluble lytic murein transglycosylase-like protein